MELRASTVIKLGGSLLGLADLPRRLTNYLADFARPRTIVICGGGSLVDQVRDWDRTYSLGEEESHWLALRLLSISSRVVAGLLPRQLTLAHSPEDCESAWESRRIPVYDPYHYIVDIDEASLDPLPRRWRVTSDSIAARMATTFGANELILLKSTTLEERLSTIEAAERDVVDPHFPTAARGLPRVVAFNLRAELPRETILYDALT